GFTNGYYTGELGNEMFGFRKKEDVVSATESLFKEIRNSYKDEMPRVALTGKFRASLGENPVFEITDGENTVVVKGEEKAEKAIKLPLDREKAEKQLLKTGGTPFYFDNISTQIEDNISIPLSSLNKIRRNALSEMADKRDFSHNYTFKMPCLEITPANQRITERRAEVKKIDDNISADYDLVYVPVDASDRDIALLKSKGIDVGVSVPRGLFGREEKIKSRLKELKDKGIEHLLCNNLCAVYFGKKLGFTVHGGEFLNLTNTYSLLWAEEYGLEDVTLSIELTVEQINELGGNIKRGVVTYGYIPLMLTRNCPVKSGTEDCKSCKKRGKMQDRKNYQFSLFCDGNCTEVLNSVPLFIPDKNKKEFFTFFTTDRFYVENYVEKVENYKGNHSKTLEKVKFTRGLYYRGVK
ncbi:MAG: DUF3656 domain-containing protein, partial [Ruminococcus sp.]